MQITRTITARALGVALLTASGLAAPMMLAGPADAAACSSTPITAGQANGCDATGTLTLTGGALTAKPPTALTWGGALTGADQEIVDSTGQSMEVDDLTGSGAGWHVTVAATTFTGTLNNTHALANAGTLKVNGSTSSDTATTAPTAGCAGTDACTSPQPGSGVSSYPVAIATASSPTPVTVYSAAKDSGLGKISLTKLGWWIHVPADTYQDTYTSTITFSVISAP